MNAYMHPDTARALLKQSRDYTDSKRAERAERQRKEALRAQGRALAVQMGGWSESAMGELAEVFAGMQQ